MASIRKVPRKSGGVSYRVQWRDPDGTQKAKSFRLSRDARDYAATVETDKQRGDYRDPEAGRITFKAYAEEWLSIQTFNPSTHALVEDRLTRFAYPHIGGTPLGQLTPSKIQAMVKALERTVAERPNKRRPRDVGYVPRTLSPYYVRTILGHVQTVLNAAVADGRIGRNPMASSAVKPPRAERHRIEPWTTDRVVAVSEALPEDYRIVLTLAAGLGLRQGEVFGLAVDDVDFLRNVVHVRRQVKLLKGRLIFDSLKGGKTRDVPLPESVKLALAAHLERHPAISCELPWGDLSGRPKTFPLIVTTPDGEPWKRGNFNRTVWSPALAGAGVEPSRDNGMHALRHWYASVLLHSGQSIRTLADYLGHSDPAFTLRTYAHLMPESAEGTRKAVDDALSGAESRPHVDDSLTFSASGSPEVSVSPGQTRIAQI